MDAAEGGPWPAPLFRMTCALAGVDSALIAACPPRDRDGVRLIAALMLLVWLTPGIHRAYCSAVSALEGNAAVSVLARGQAGGAYQGQPVLFSTEARAFLADHTLAEEMFGAASLVVRCRDASEVRAVLARLEGQLTAALHMDEADHEAARTLMPLLERKVGRILVNGFGTGVEVGHAMVHGGPYPATSDGRTTSVGSLAITRFLRPVCYQDVPDALLPEELRAGNPLGLWRRIDGSMPTKSSI